MFYIRSFVLFVRIVPFQVKANEKSKAKAKKVKTRNSISADMQKDSRCLSAGYLTVEVRFHETFYFISFFLGTKKINLFKEFF